MVFKIRITGNLGPVNAVTVDFGDGVAATQPPSDRSTPDRACSDAEGRGDSGFALDFSHPYRRAGSYPVRITTVDLACHPDVVSQGPAFTANVTQGESHSNGPALPTVRNCVLDTNGFCASADGRHATAYAGSLADADGYVAAVRVDWGDGSAVANTTFPMSDCRDPGTRWPSSERTNASWDHTYARAGSYTITLTVFSAGCDSRDVQQSAFTEQLTVA
jgi:hypothetical protein